MIAITSKMTNPSDKITKTTPDSNAYFVYEFVTYTWKKKFVFLAFFTTIMSSFIAYAFLATPYYRASVLLSSKSNSNQTSRLSALADQFASVASVAGIDSSTASTNIDETIAILKSRKFTYAFIEEYGLIHELFEDRWDYGSNTWKPKVAIPTIWDAYEKFSSIREASIDKKSKLVTIEIVWKDPEKSALWANALANKLNYHLKAKAIQESQKSIDYLQEQANQTSELNIKQLMFKMIEQELQTIKLASTREDFAFEIIDPAIVPEHKFKPIKRLVVFTGFLSSIILSFLWIFIMKITSDLRQTQRRTRI